MPYPLSPRKPNPILALRVQTCGLLPNPKYDMLPSEDGDSLFLKQ